MSSKLNVVRLGATKGAKSKVIWMHGLGDSSDGFKDLFQQQFVPLFPDTLFLLPNAPVRPITVNGGMKMQGWYDIFTLGNSRSTDDRQDSAGIWDAFQSIKSLVEEERAGGFDGPLVLGGFSQGGAMALFAGLQLGKPIVTGIISTSGYLLLKNELVPGKLHANTPPVFAWHGKDDDIVPVGLAKTSYECLASNNVAVETNYEPGLTHSLSMAELQQIVLKLKAWL